MHNCYLSTSNTYIKCLTTLWQFVLFYRDVLPGLQIALEALQGYLTLAEVSLEASANM